MRSVTTARRPPASTPSPTTSLTATAWVPKIDADELQKVAMTLGLLLLPPHRRLGDDPTIKFTNSDIEAVTSDGGQDQQPGVPDLATKLIASAGCWRPSTFMQADSSPASSWKGAMMIGHTPGEIPDRGARTQLRKDGAMNALALAAGAPRSRRSTT